MREKTIIQDSYRKYFEVYKHCDRLCCFSSNHNQSIMSTKYTKMENYVFYLYKMLYTRWKQSCGLYIVYKKSNPTFSVKKDEKLYEHKLDFEIEI